MEKDFKAGSGAGGPPRNVKQGKSSAGPCSAKPGMAGKERASMKIHPYPKPRKLHDG